MGPQGKDEPRALGFRKKKGGEPKCKKAKNHKKAKKTGKGEVKNLNKIGKQGPTHKGEAPALGERQRIKGGDRVGLFSTQRGKSKPQIVLLSEKRIMLKGDQTSNLAGTKFEEGNKLKFVVEKKRSKKGTENQSTKYP